jgi:Na+/H+ antiporter NhaA
MEFEVVSIWLFVVDFGCLLWTLVVLSGMHATEQFE